MIRHTREAWALRGWAVAALATLLLATRLLFFDANAVFIALNAFAPFTYALGHVSLVIAFFSGARALGAASLVLGAAHIFLLWPTQTNAPAFEDGVVIKVMSANVLYSNRTPRTLAQEIAQADPDVLMVQEMTGHWLAVLGQEGVLEKYPHKEIVLRENAFGIATFSKLPMDILGVPEVEDLPMVDSRLQLGSTTLRLLNVHTAPPTRPVNVEIWERQFTVVQTFLEGAASEPVLIAGDLNATRYNAPIRALAKAGARSCHSELGKNFIGTFPNGMSPIPFPDIHIDHVLVSGGVRCEDIKEGVGGSSDHRPLVAVVSVGPAAAVP